MIDPLAEVVLLLEPHAPYSKVVNAAGRWVVNRSEYGQPFYCVVLTGSCRLIVEESEPLLLTQGDFVLIPSANRFSMSSLQPAISEELPVKLADGEYRLGNQSGAAEMRSVIGYCEFGSPDAALLVSLLPRIVLVRGEERLATLVGLLAEEARLQRPAREIVLARLLEVLLVEALRSSADAPASSGMLHGLADERLATAIRSMHEHPAQPWTVAQLAKAAALSRSAFFESFKRAVGVAPMEYLLAWRMALAKNMLGKNQGSIAEISERVGYSSASTFSVAFTRYVGMPPTKYLREIATPKVA